jgi:hypothetical protein
VQPCSLPGSRSCRGTSVSDIWVARQMAKVLSSRNFGTKARSAAGSPAPLLGWRA